MGTAARKLSYKSHHPRLIASWTTREVAVPLKHGEAGATPVDAPNEDVTQMDRVLASETSGHRYCYLFQRRFANAEASYDPCHPRSWEWIGITCSETNKRTVACGKAKPTIPTTQTLRVVKPFGHTRKAERICSRLLSGIIQVQPLGDPPNSTFG